METRNIHGIQDYGYYSRRNERFEPGDDFEEKYQRYFQKLKNDTAYKKTFCKYEKTSVIDVFIKNEFHDELKEYKNNRKVN